MNGAPRRLFWLPIDSAPKGVRVQVKMKDGTIYEDAHWASDLSGEEQPPFQGWYIPVIDSEGRESHFREIEEPVEWKSK